MDIEQAIFKRRSIRKYSPKDVDKKDINKVIEAATWAPSGLNNQPWTFKVISDKQEKDSLAGFTKYGKIIKSAPVAICVFLDNSATYNRDKDIMAVGACIQNMLLQAYSLGLATCWLGEILNKRAEVEERLGTEADHELMAVVTLGYPEEGEVKSSRKGLNTFLIS